MPALPVLPSFLIIIVVAGYLHVRGRDIRMILLLAAAGMYFVRVTQPETVGQRWNLFGDYFLEFAKGLTNAGSVVPICSAMGFAYVCKFTRCDAHLVNLLVAPLRVVRPLLIPGGIAVAFVVNSAIVSQTSTVAVVGPVLIPLLLAAGVSRKTAGALLLLGGSMGGELLNPAAIEVTAIKLLTKQDAILVVKKMLPYNLVASGTALLVFWLMSFYWQKHDTRDIEEHVAEVGKAGSLSAMMNSDHVEPLARVNVLKALVPLVPILLLMFVKPNIPLPAAFVYSDTNKIAEQASIAAAMIIGAACAAIVSLENIDGLVAAFFEGAGFTFVHVIPVIIGATMFARGVEMNGLIEQMARALRSSPHFIGAAALLVGWLMAMVTGTAVGTAPLVINMMLPIALPRGLVAATRTGSIAAIAAQFGRTASPVAPVAVMCATLSRHRVETLVKRVIPPMICGAIVMLLLAIWRG